jgi:hypothetical protein
VAVARFALGCVLFFFALDVCEPCGIFLLFLIVPVAVNVPMTPTALLGLAFFIVLVYSIALCDPLRRRPPLCGGAYLLPWCLLPLYCVCLHVAPEVYSLGFYTPPLAPPPAAALPLSLVDLLGPSAERSLRNPELRRRASLVASAKDAAVAFAPSAERAFALRGISFAASAQGAAGAGHRVFCDLWDADEGGRPIKRRSDGAGSVVVKGVGVYTCPLVDRKGGDMIVPRAGAWGKAYAVVLRSPNAGDVFDRPINDNGIELFAVTHNNFAPRGLLLY